MIALRVLIAVSMFAVTAPVAAAPAGKFMNDSVQGDRSETTLGRLIHAGGQSAKARAFGATLERDHSRAHAQALGLARRMHVRVNDTMMPEARTELAKLKSLHGKAFDREVRRYMVDDHHKDIAEFKSQVRHGDRQTAALARQTLPTLKKHLALAQALPR